MSLRKVRGFRLGRRLVRVWGWILWRRSRRHRHLEQDRSPSPDLSVRLLRWACSLKRGFCSPAKVGSGDEGLKRRLLEVEEKPPPKGQLVVYVGGGKDDEPPQRYLVPVLNFNHPLFGELLREAEEEFGFNHPGRITIPCPAWRFERVQTRIASGGAAARRKGTRRNFWCL